MSMDYEVVELLDGKLGINVTEFGIIVLLRVNCLRLMRLF